MRADDLADRHVSSLTEPPFPRILATFSGAKNSGIGTVPATVPRNRAVSSSSSRSAPKSSCISGGGGSSMPSWYVNS
jgi:hypothetical protein